MKRLFFLLAILAATGIAFAAPVEADPNKDYHVTPEAGPWMICAASFIGPQAPHLAHDLVLEIRQAFNLNAYIFDRGREEMERQREQIRKIRENCPEGTKVRLFRVQEQYAVLVGGYKDMDSARKELDRIKKLKPSDKFMQTVRVGDLRSGGEEVERARISPFLSAFVVHNPTVKIEKTNEESAEYPFLKKINSGESYSLLKCNKPVTLLVKSYQGCGAIQPRESKNTFMDMIGLGNRTSVLTAGGLQAHALAEWLSHIDKMPIKAYVLHTRNYSFVSVGAFDSVDDPKLKELQQVMPQIQLGGLPPDQQLMSHPVPMKVPQPN